jgi:hypothetical protein
MQSTCVTRIFLDLDGVLADWASAAIRLHGLDPATVLATWPPGIYELADVLGISGNAMWRPINMARGTFWAKLEPLPWVHDLMHTCMSIAPTTILTSPSKDPDAASGKTQWLQTMFGADFRDYLIGPAKAACAYRGAVLIDDRDEGCKSFIAAGGHAIVFPQPWNSEHAVVPWIEREGPAGYVRDRMRRVEEMLRAA